MVGAKSIPWPSSQLSTSIIGAPDLDHAKFQRLQTARDFQLYLPWWRHSRFPAFWGSMNYRSSYHRACEENILKIGIPLITCQYDRCASWPWTPLRILWYESWGPTWNLRLRRDYQDWLSTYLITSGANKFQSDRSRAMDLLRDSYFYPEALAILESFVRNVTFEKLKTPSTWCMPGG